MKQSDDGEDVEKGWYGITTKVYIIDEGQTATNTRQSPLSEPDARIKQSRL